MPAHQTTIDERSRLPLAWVGPIVIAAIAAAGYILKVESKADGAVVKAEQAVLSVSGVDAKLDQVLNRMTTMDQRLSRIEGAVLRGR